MPVGWGGVCFLLNIYTCGVFHFIIMDNIPKLFLIIYFALKVKPDWWTFFKIL